MRPSVLMLICIAITVASSPMGIAQDFQHMCFPKSGAALPHPDEMIVGCTALLKSGSETPRGTAEVLSSRATAYREKGQYDRAISDQNAAITIVPNDADLIYGRALIFEKQGSRNAAINDYKKALQLDPTYNEAREAIIRLQK